MMMLTKSQLTMMKLILTTFCVLFALQFIPTSEATGIHLQQQFQEAVAANDVHAVEHLVHLYQQNPTLFDPCFNNNEAMQTVCEKGYLSILQLLLDGTHCDPAFEFNLPIRLAAQHGHAPIVKALMDSERVNPTDHLNLAIVYATGNGHTDVVRQLLTDPRVRPDTEENLPLRHAAGHGYVDIVRILLGDPRVDPCAKDNQALYWAANRGQWQVVQVLMQDVRVRPHVHVSLLRTLMDRYTASPIKSQLRRVQFALLSDPRILRDALLISTESGALRSLQDEQLLFWMGYFLHVDLLGTSAHFHAIVNRAIQALETKLPWLQGEIKTFLYRPGGRLARKMSRQFSEKQLE